MQNFGTTESVDRVRVSARILRNFLFVAYYVSRVCTGRVPDDRLQACECGTADAAASSCVNLACRLIFKNAIAYVISEAWEVYSGMDRWSILRRGED